MRFLLLLLSITYCAAAGYLERSKDGDMLFSGLIIASTLCMSASAICTEINQLRKR